MILSHNPGLGVQLQFAIIRLFIINIQTLSCSPDILLSKLSTFQMATQSTWAQINKPWVPLPSKGVTAPLRSDGCHKNKHVSINGYSAFFVFLSSALLQCEHIWKNLIKELNTNEET